VRTGEDEASISLKVDSFSAPPTSVAVASEMEMAATPVQERERALEGLMAGLVMKSSEEQELGEVAAVDSTAPARHRYIQRFQAVLRRLVRKDTTGKATVALFHSLKAVVVGSGSASQKKASPKAKALRTWDYRKWMGPRAVCGVSMKDRVRVERWLAACLEMIMPYAFASVSHAQCVL